MSASDERYWMKKCCGLCPFSRKNTLWLHPERAEEFAYMVQNPFSNFPCHKTADYQEETEFHEGGYVHGEHSFTCMGFISLQVEETGEAPEGFKPDPDAFYDAYEMIDHHTEEWERQRGEQP